MIYEVAHEMFAAVLAAGDSLTVLAAAPDPGDGVAPPGSEKIITLLEYGKWIFTAIAVAGGLWIGSKMVFAHQRGDDAGVGKLGYWLAGCVLASAAPSLVDALS